MNLWLDSLAMRFQQTDALGADAPLELGHAAESRKVQVRGDVRQRIQNEVALHYPGMRQRQVCIGSPLARIRQQIEVEDARAPALALGRPAERALEGAQFLQQVLRRSAASAARRPR